jgi:hypothetical protein
MDFYIIWHGVWKATWCSPSRFVEGPGGLHDASCEDADRSVTHNPVAESTEVKDEANLIVSGMICACKLG